MKPARHLSILLIALISLTSLSLSAGPLTVCTKSSPPFSFQDETGQWKGITIDLLNEVTAELGYQPTYKLVSLKEMIAGLKTGECDLSASALTITAEREKNLDFTAPYYSAGLGIAVSDSGDKSLAILAAVKKLFSWEMLVVVSSLLFVLFVAGFAVWLFERKANKEEFGGSTAEGLGASLWWSAVTMTTVGYGDKSPRTVGGRIVALIWMFTAIIIISSFTAGIASVLTISSFKPSVKSVSDLRNVSVGSVPHSYAEETLDSLNINFRNYDDSLAGLKAVNEGMITAFVYDAPILHYALHSRPEFNQSSILENEFATQHYAVAFPQDSPLREPFSFEILKVVKSPRFERIKESYLAH